jgi:hypothetical protein
VRLVWRVRFLFACVAAAVAVPGQSQVYKGYIAPPGAPTVARLQGDGAGVDLSWYAVNSAVGGYEVLRASKPGEPPVKIGSARAGTLGFRDPKPISGAAYYQVVSIGPNGRRIEGAWILYAPPVVTSASRQGTDVVVAWSASENAPGGYEIWRRSGASNRAVRVGTVANGQLSYRDTQAGSDPFDYQVVAIATGGMSAASQWFASAACCDTNTAGAQSKKQKSGIRVINR